MYPTLRKSLPRLGSPITFVLAFLLASTPLLAQGAAPRVQSDLFGETVDVRVVNLEVVVEKKGERVLGLEGDDFVLRVDGQPVPIEFFSEVRDSATLDPAAADSGTTDTGGVVPALSPGEVVGTRYLVFIDDVFTFGPRRNRILRQLQNDLSQLGPSDSMAIVAFDGHHIELLTSWTRSERDLERALAAAEKRTTSGLRHRAVQSLDDDYRFATGRTAPFGYGYTGPGEQAYAEVRGVVDAAASTLRAFAQPEGRKVMLLLSGSWPPAYSSVGFEEFVSYNSYSRSNRDIFEPLIDTANLLGYTVYPIDVPGVEAQLVSASHSSLAEASYVRETSRDREFVRESVLIDIADQTGGKALLDGASQAVLERVQNDTSAYYSIGFTPKWQANDRRHSVDIELPGMRGVKVRQRSSFIDLSPGTTATLRLESVQLFDLPVPNEGGLQARFGEPEDSGWRKVVVPLAVDIPLDRVTWLPNAQGFATRLELRVAVTDDRGDRADIPVIPIILQGSRDQEPGALKTFVTHLEMRERPHKVFVSLLDPATGAELSARLDVDFDS